MPLHPNILWISMEDTSPRFGCYGDSVAHTPNIDRLAAEGRRYTNAFSTAGVCAPSRSAIITGMYQTSIGTHHMRTTHTNPSAPGLPTPYSAVPPAYVKTFTEYLRAAGYYCTNNWKTDYQFEPPLTAWDECSREAHWRNREPGQPFFSVFNFTITHESGMWPKDTPIVTDPSLLKLPPYLPDTPKVRESLARQYDNIAASDQMIGELLAQLEDDGLYQDTIVFLWSDHGEGLPRAKRWPYDAGIRVPLIVRWPGRLESGSVTDELVSMVDLGPTVLSLAGLEVPYHMQGQPFLGSEARAREYVYATRDRHDESYDMVRAVRDKRYKYIRNYHPEKPYLLWIPYSHKHPALQEMWRMYAHGELKGTQQLMFRSHRPTEELYDCDNDPYEINNLATDPAHRSVLDRMRCALDEWRDRYGDMGEIPEDRMVRQMWPGGTQPKTSAPVFIPISDRDPGLVPVSKEGTYSGPLVVLLYCASEGASIAYTFQTGERARWQLYSEPLQLPAGSTTIRAKAIRIGYQESDESVGTFKVVHEET